MYLRTYACGISIAWEGGKVALEAGDWRLETGVSFLCLSMIINYGPTESKPCRASTGLAVHAKRSSCIRLARLIGMGHGMGTIRVRTDVNVNLRFFVSAQLQFKTSPRSRKISVVNGGG